MTVILGENFQNCQYANRLFCPHSRYFILLSPCYNKPMFSEPSANLAKLGLVDGMKVVDLGAGSGFYSYEAARRVGATGRVYAVDVQKDLLERLRSNGA